MKRIIHHDSIAEYAKTCAVRLTKGKATRPQFRAIAREFYFRAIDRLEAKHPEMRKAS